MFGLTKIEKAKRDNPVEEVISRYGVELKSYGGNGKLKGLCPFHDDTTPSLSVTTSKGLWNCFAGCGGGSVIDFIMKAESVDEKKAVEILLNARGIRPIAKPIEKPGIDPAAILPEVCRIYANVFKQTTSAQEYLVKRGITDKDLWERFRIGYADGHTLKEILPRSGELADQIKSIGILNDAGNESFYKCVTFPITNESGMIVGLYGRSTTGKRQMYIKGPHKGVWNEKAAKVYDTLILTESIIDALSLVQIGIANAIPIYGTNGLTSDHIELFENNRIKEVILVLDNDLPGRKAVDKIAEKIKGLKILVSSITLPDGAKDPNDFLLQGGTRDQFDKLLSNRVPLSKPAPDEDREGEGLISRTEDGAHFMFGEILYHIRGLRMKAFDSMRVVVTADSGQAKHTDRLDLYVSKSRRSFANTVAGKLKGQAAKIEDDLLAVIEHLEGIQKEEIEKRSTENKPRRMTQTEREEALAFLQDRNILGRIVGDLSICGYVGEETAKKICYLSATSRITKKPLSVIVRSSSAAGKSDLMEKVAALMPPEEVSFYSRITPQALYYMEKDELKHKLLIVDERAGSEEADYSIRNLQSREKLTLAVVIRDPSSGKSRTVTLELEGPCVIWESTTQARINSENSSRCFEVWLDEGTEQTLRIQRAQRTEFSAEGWGREPDREKIIQTHRNAQRLLRPLRVEIPCLDRLSFPAGWMRTRRDHQRFLSLIAVVALLHQYQRDIETTPSGEAYIEATMDDYRSAYEIGIHIMGYTLSHLQKDTQDLLDELTELAERGSKENGIQPDEFAFSRRDIRERTNWPDKKIYRCMGDLIDMEYVRIACGRQGKMYLYKLNEDRKIKRDPSAGITTPEELEKILSG